MLDDLIKNVGAQFGLGDKAGDFVAMITKHVQAQGGLPGLLQAFQNNGAGEKAASWVSTGANVDPTPDETGAALGGDFVTQMAQQFGVDPGAITGAASQIVPQMVDKATPNGEVPQGFDMMEAVKGMVGNLDLGTLLGK